MDVAAFHISQCLERNKNDLVLYRSLSSSIVFHLWLIPMVLSIPELQHSFLMPIGDKSLSLMRRHERSHVRITNPYTIRYPS